MNPVSAMFLRPFGATLALGLLAPSVALAAEGHGHFDGRLISWQTINVIMLIGVLMFLYRKFGGGEALKNRRREIAEGLEEAKRLKDAAEAKYKEYEERMAKLDQELEAMRAEMISAGKKERDRIVQEAEAKGARLRKEAQFLVDQQLKQLKVDLTREAVEAAIKTAEQVLSEKMTPADQQKLARDYLDRLGKMAGRPASSTAVAPAPLEREGGRP